MVVIAGVGDVFEDGGDAKEDDVEEHVEEVAEGEAEHELVEVLLDQLSRKPDDSRCIAHHSKQPHKQLKRGFLEMASSLKTRFIYQSSCFSALRGQKCESVSHL